MEKLIHKITEDCPELKVNQEQLTHHLEEVQTENISWIIRSFATLGAWFGMGTFMAFLFGTRLLESSGSMLLVGIFCTIGSLLIPRISVKNLLFEPLALSMGMIGQGLICAGIIDNVHKDWYVFFLIFAIIETIIFVFTKSQTQRFLSIIAFGYCILGFCWDLHFFIGVHLFIGLLVLCTMVFLLMENKIINHFPKILISYNTIHFALSISITCLIAIHAFFITSKYKMYKTDFSDFLIYDWIVSVIIIGSTIYSIYYLLQEQKVKEYFWVAIIGSGVLLASTFFISAGISWALLLIILGVFRSQKTTLAIGIICFLYFLNLFYYGLEINLLNKSIILMLSGVLFISVGLFIRLKFLKHDEK